MAATALSNLVVPSLYLPYVNAYLTERLSLAASGIFRVDTNPPFTKGTTFSVPRYAQLTSSAWQTPTATTTLTAYNIAANNEIGVMWTRSAPFGNEILNDIITGDDAMAEINRQIAHLVGVKWEAMAGNVLTGLFATGGPLATSHICGGSDVVLNPNIAVDADNVMGEHLDALTHVIMHSACVNQQRKAGYISNIESIAADQAKFGNWFGGIWAGKTVVVNDRISTATAGVYTIYFAGQGAGYMAYKIPVQVLTDQNILLAGGTDLINVNVSGCIHVNQTSWTGTAPSVIGGVTDAAAITGTNWSRVNSSGTADEVRVVKATCILETA